MRKSAFLFPLIVLSFFCVFFFSSQLKAQFIPSIGPEDLIKEPPLTQADIDFTIKYYQLLKLFHVDEEEDAPDKILDFLDNSGFTVERQAYASRKTTIVAAVLDGEITMDEIEGPYFLFNADEEELVKKNLPALNKAIDEAFPQ
jgi:hypothetical protein